MVVTVPTDRPGRENPSESRRTGAIRITQEYHDQLGTHELHPALPLLVPHCLQNTMGCQVQVTEATRKSTVVPTEILEMDDRV